MTILAIYHRALLATMADYLYLYNKVVIMQLQIDFTYLCNYILRDYISVLLELVI